MTLIFDFLGFLSWNWLQWLFFFILVAAYLFLMIGSLDLKKKDFKSTTLLFVAGLLLLIWVILDAFLLPTVSGVTPTDMERLLGFLYSLFFMTGLIQGLFHVILGIGFMKLGKSNRDPGGIIAMIGGILYLVAWIVNLILRTLSKLSGWFGLTLLGPIGFFLNILAWVINFVVLGAAVLILVYSFLTKRPLFIIFALLFLAAYLLQVLSLLGFL